MTAAGVGASGPGRGATVAGWGRRLSSSLDRVLAGGADKANSYSRRRRRRRAFNVGLILIAFCMSVSGIVFLVATTCLYTLTFAPLGLGELSRHLFQGSGLGHLLAYVGVSVLACAGYGAVFLLMGLVMRNPVVAGVFIWGWEAIHFLLPALLKKLSVIYYLKALYPVPLPDRVLSVVEDPISPWLAVPGLLVFTAGVLFVSGWLARRLEISYGGE